jgi:hypothetical protein
MSRPTLRPESLGSFGRGPIRRRSGFGRRDEIRCALISAICHAHMTDEHEDAPESLTPMPLNRLVQVLQSSGDAFTRELAAAWLLDNRDREDALKPYAAALIGSERLARFSFGDLPGSVSFEEASEHPNTRFGHACDVLFGLARCEPKNHRLVASLDPQTLVTKVVAEVDVNPSRPPHRFKKHSDPRGWETHASLFFKRSRLCTLENADFTMHPNPSTIGDNDYDGLLLEFVSLGFAPGFPLDSLNVLNVTCRSQRHTPNFQVALFACLELLLGMSWSRGGLDVDSGEFSAEATDRATHLRGTKVARFAEREVLGIPLGRQLNYFAPLSLAALMSILIFGGACHDPY